MWVISIIIGALGTVGNWMKNQDHPIIIIIIIIKLWNMLVISIILGALGTVLKDQNRWRLDEKSRPSKLQFCQDQPEYWEKSWRPEETCCHSDSSESPPVNTGMKNLQGVK